MIKKEKCKVEFSEHMVKRKTQFNIQYAKGTKPIQQ